MPLAVDLISLHPDYFSGPLSCGMLGRAQRAGHFVWRHHDLRLFGEGERRRVDDRPFGGGPGMVLMPGPACRAIRAAKASVSSGERTTVIYLSPQGERLSAALCRLLAEEGHLVLFCGHYEGLDERVISREVDREISIGDYVLLSGCAAALVLIESVIRFVPGVLGHPEAANCDSFEGEGIFDCPHYTHPRCFEGGCVPELLFSGDHGKIAAWRHEAAMCKTRRVRPDLVRRPYGVEEEL